MKIKLGFCFTRRTAPCLEQKNGIIAEQAAIIEQLRLRLQQCEMRRQETDQDSHESKRMRGSTAENVAASTSPDLNVFTGEEGIGSLQGTAGRLKSMSLIDQQTLMNKVPEICGQADVPDYIAARIKQEEEDAKFARS